MKNVLVIGGGVAGIQSALDLGDRGYHVYLVEREPSIGGHMALLDKTFPTNDCSMCILAPKMNECNAHPNVEFLSYSEVVGLTGSVGDFTARVLRKARFVDEEKCTGCGECAAKCPSKVPNEYNMNLDTRKAIFLPFPQAVPRVMTIDKERCLYLTKEKCGNCKKACNAGAVDFEQKDTFVDLDVIAVIVATGFDLFDPTIMSEYGYGRYANVITAMEYERMICASGPTEGHLKTAPNEEHPKKIAFIQCVGSRDLQHTPYCSSVCCMHAVKESILAREHYEDIEPHIFYTDLRAVGKGFEEYTRRAENDYGIHYTRSRPGQITEDAESKKLTVWYDDTINRKVEGFEVDMVVLCNSFIPAKGQETLADILGIELDDNGFFKSKDELTASLDSGRPGIFIAGCCQFPKDIPESVAQGSGAAARVSEVGAGGYI